MFKKRAQGLSINVIIIAVIGLIILVVVIAMFTGRLGQFSEGLDSAITCESTCNAIGRDFARDISAQGCKLPTTQGRIIPGTYPDATGINVDGNEIVCCCIKTI